MLNTSHLRLIFQAFVVVLYVICGVGILFGLFMFLCGLAAILDLSPFGTEFAPGAGPGFLAGGLGAVATFVVFIFLVRTVFRYVLTNIEKIDKQQQQSPDSIDA